MEGDKGLADSLLPDSIQQLPGEVQSRCGGRCRTQGPGVHRLVALLVLELLLNIRRQRHFTQALQNLQKNSLIMKLHHPVSVLLHLGHRGGEGSISEAHRLALLHFPARLHQALPGSASQIPQQQDLHSPACGPLAQKAGRQHPGVIHHQAVPRIQIVDDIIKMPVLQRAGSPVQHQKPGAVPPLQRRLGNQLLRQIIPKIMGFHGISPHLSVKRAGYFVL